MTETTVTMYLPLPEDYSHPAIDHLIGDDPTDIADHCMVRHQGVVMTYETVSTAEIRQLRILVSLSVDEISPTIQELIDLGVPAENLQFSIYGGMGADDGSGPYDYQVEVLIDLD